jgi:tetratricopeptide (TPR) repeat protein
MQDVFLCGKMAEHFETLREHFAQRDDVKVHSVLFLGRIAPTVKLAHRPLLVLCESDKSDRRSAFALLNQLRCETRWFHVPVLMCQIQGRPPTVVQKSFDQSLVLNVRLSLDVAEDTLAQSIHAILAQEQNAPFEVKNSRRAELALAEGKPSKAMSLLYSVLEQAPKFAPAHALLGEAWLRSGESKKARAFFQSALHIDPKFLAALWGLGKCASREKNHADAIELFRQAAAQDVLSLPQLKDLGKAHLAVNDTSSAKVAFESILGHDPDDADATAGLGEVALLEGDVELAVKLFDACKRPDQLATSLNELGIAMANTGNFDAAVAAYTRASAFLSSSRKLHLLEYNVGLAYWRAERFEEAVEWFRKALEREPNYERARRALERTQSGKRTRSA